MVEYRLQVLQVIGRHEYAQPPLTHDADILVSFCISHCSTKLFGNLVQLLQLLAEWMGTLTLIQLPVVEHVTRCPRLAPCLWWGRARAWYGAGGFLPCVQRLQRAFPGQLLVGEFAVRRRPLGHSWKGWLKRGGATFDVCRGCGTAGSWCG
jgi:hypothetical protein